MTVNEACATLIYVISRARQALAHLQSRHHTSIDIEYLNYWWSRMQVELVSARNSHMFQFISLCRSSQIA